MRFLLLVFFVLLLVACMNEKQDVLDMTDVLPSSERYKEGEGLPVVQKSGLIYDTLAPNWQNLIDTLGIPKEALKSSDTLLFIDRFSPKKQYKLYWKNENDSISLNYWEFEDSITCENAWFNWLDCFGPQCIAFRPGENRNLQKRGFILLYNAQGIISISGVKKLDLLYYLASFKALESGQTWKCVVTQKTGGKMQWFKYDGKELQVLNE
jgi:hypothetical protein